MKLLYVTDYTGSIVLIYKQGATGAGPIGEIVTGIDQPQGDAVDKSGTLYVANEGNNTVTEYPRRIHEPERHVIDEYLPAARCLGRFHRNRLCNG